VDNTRKDYFDLIPDEHEALAQQGVKEAIAEMHAAGVATVEVTALPSVMRYTRLKYKYFEMKSYSIDLREKIVAAHVEKNISIRKVADIFSVSKSLVQKLVKQQKVEGNLQPKPRGKPHFSHLTNAEIELRELVETQERCNIDRVV